jgi:hypothetical protein
MSNSYMCRRHFRCFDRDFIAPAIVRFLLSAFVRLYFEPAQNLGTRRYFQQQQKQKGKRRSAGAGTGRDEQCNHCCIGRCDSSSRLVARLICLPKKPCNVNNTRKLLVGTLRQAGCHQHGRRKASWKVLPGSTSYHRRQHLPRKPCLHAGLGPSPDLPVRPRPTPAPCPLRQTHAGLHGRVQQPLDPPRRW